MTKTANTFRTHSDTHMVTHMVSLSLSLSLVLSVSFFLFLESLVRREGGSSSWS